MCSFRLRSLILVVYVFTNSGTLFPTFFVYFQIVDKDFGISIALFSPLISFLADELGTGGQFRWLECHLHNEGWVHFISNTMCLLSWLYTLTDCCWSISCLCCTLWQTVVGLSLDVISPFVSLSTSYSPSFDLSLSMLFIRVLYLLMWPNYLACFIFISSNSLFIHSLSWTSVFDCFPFHKI